MKENEMVRDFFSRVAEIINQIKSCGEEVPEKKVVEKILRSLPHKFEHIIVVIIETKNLRTLTQFELMGTLEAYEQRMSNCNNKPLEQAFQVKTHISKNSLQQGRRGSSFGQAPGRGRGQKFQNRGRGKGEFEKSDVECYVCNRKCHESRNCWWRCKTCKVPNHADKDCWHKQKNKQGEEQKETHFSARDESCKLFISRSDSTKSATMWYLDSGCSNHLSGNQEDIHEIDRSYSSHVELGDGKKVTIDGK
ncbi:uncharacterized protein LOC127259847 [Andrographis paniculata]|uniref:uncharacterized protein LOC127259847 n=1 Tax=Andrographis paniculata TaxID=175694 RepID=UPI0021E8C7EE|nr:uncharacterized protein LOC127259847 [Andrographis paniculata]